MTAPIVTRAESRQTDIPLGPARQTLRVTLTTTEHGAPDAVVLAIGWGGAGTGDPFHRPGWAEGPLRLPATILPALRAALEALGGSS